MQQHPHLNQFVAEEIAEILREHPATIHSNARTAVTDTALTGLKIFAPLVAASSIALAGAQWAVPTPPNAFAAIATYVVFVISGSCAVGAWRRELCPARE